MRGMHTAGTNTCSCAEVSILGHACAMLPRHQCEVLPVLLVLHGLPCCCVIAERQGRLGIPAVPVAVGGEDALPSAVYGCFAHRRFVHGWSMAARRPVVCVVGWPGGSTVPTQLGRLGGRVLAAHEFRAATCSPCGCHAALLCCLAGGCCCSLAWPCISGLAMGLCHPLLLGQLLSCSSDVS